jgi:hypothetical protein
VQAAEGGGLPEWQGFAGFGQELVLVVAGILPAVRVVFRVARREGLGVIGLGFSFKEEVL